METELDAAHTVYQTRLLLPSDLDAMQGLFERGADYFVIATGNQPVPDEARRAYVAGPPTKDVKAKRIVGIFADDALVGVLDALTNWPAEGTWTMGMLLLDPAHRGAGLGRATLAAYERWAASEGAQIYRTAIVAHHDPGARFLQRAGYTCDSTGVRDAAEGSRPAVLFFQKVVSREEKGLS